jgi:uncharacterized membrane protein YfcA
MDVLRAWAVPAVIGVAAGSAIAAFAPAAVLKLAFALIASVIAFKLLVGRDSWRLADDLPGSADKSTQSAQTTNADKSTQSAQTTNADKSAQSAQTTNSDKSAQSAQTTNSDKSAQSAQMWNPGMIGYGFFLGLAASLMGISGGSIANMILTLHGKPMHNAVATSAGLGVPITIAGTIGYMLAGLPQQALLPPFSIGFVSLIGFALMAPVASFTAPYGARLAHRLSKRRLEIAFGCFLLTVCVRFVVSLVV